MIGQKLEKILTPKDTHLHAVEFAGMGYESFDQDIRKYIQHLGKKYTTETTSFGADIESDYDDTIESYAGQILELIEQGISHGHHTELALRGHSLGGRTLMHTLLRYPEILDHTREITLIHIPLHLDIFPGSQIQKIFSRKGLQFSDTFLESLAVDTLDINDQFIALLQEKGWKGDISAVSDREDTTLTKLYGPVYPMWAREFSKELREFRDISSRISEKKKVVANILNDVSFSSIMIDHATSKTEKNIGHNAENIHHELSKKEITIVWWAILQIPVFGLSLFPVDPSGSHHDVVKNIVDMEGFILVSNILVSLTAKIYTMAENNKKLNNFVLAVLLISLVYVTMNGIKNVNHNETSINTIPTGHSTWGTIL